MLARVTNSVFFNRHARVFMCLVVGVVWGVAPAINDAVKLAVAGYGRRQREGESIDDLRSFVDLGHDATYLVAWGFRETSWLYLACSTPVWLSTLSLFVRAVYRTVTEHASVEGWQPTARLLVFLILAFFLNAVCWLPRPPGFIQQEPQSVVYALSLVVSPADSFFAPRLAWITSVIMGDIPHVGSPPPPSPPLSTHILMRGWMVQVTACLRYGMIFLLQLYVLSARQMFTICVPFQFLCTYFVSRVVHTYLARAPARQRKEEEMRDLASSSEVAVLVDVDDEEVEEATFTEEEKEAMQNL